MKFRQLQTLDQKQFTEACQTAAKRGKPEFQLKKALTSRPDLITKLNGAKIRLSTQWL